MKFHDICEKSCGEFRMPARITVGASNSNPAAAPSARRFTFFITCKLCLADCIHSINDYNLLPQNLSAN